MKIGGVREEYVPGDRAEARSNLTSSPPAGSTDARNESALSLFSDAWPPPI